MKKHSLSIVSVLLAIVALGLAMAPTILIKDDVEFQEKLVVASAVLAVLGLTLATFAYVREKEPMLLTLSVLLALVAIIWQYLLVGIVLAIIIVSVAGFLLFDN